VNSQSISSMNKETVDLSSGMGGFSSLIPKTLQTTIVKILTMRNATPTMRRIAHPANAPRANMWTTMGKSQDKRTTVGDDCKHADHH
jgi:hypothetical protein